MTNQSNKNGRAYEYAWMLVLYSAINQLRNAKIVSNSSLSANKSAWDNLEEEKQRIYRISADAALPTILELEPLISEKDNDELVLEFKKDESGEEGDVRDIVIKRADIQWEIGLSIKHNHKALKHSRLGTSLDFGEKWYGVPCSQEYWNEVKPIFQKLESDKAAGVLWRDIHDKNRTVYLPLLNAFLTEIERAYEVDRDLPIKMMEYLIGKKDYYKIISNDQRRMTLIHTFNIHETLNKQSKNKISTITVPILELPTEIIKARIKPGSNNTVEMFLNNGWTLSFRIHSAKSMVEPSLKFDVQLVGAPVGILCIECRWYSQI